VVFGFSCCLPLPIFPSNVCLFWWSWFSQIGRGVLPVIFNNTLKAAHVMADPSFVQISFFFLSFLFYIFVSRYSFPSPMAMQWMEKDLRFSIMMNMRKRVETLKHRVHGRGIFFSSDSQHMRNVFTLTTPCHVF
jgi:hypothetical protein